MYSGEVLVTWFFSESSRETGWLTSWGMSSYLGQIGCQGDGVHRLSIWLIMRGSEIWWCMPSAHSLSTTLRYHRSRRYNFYRNSQTWMGYTYLPNSYIYNSFKYIERCFQFQTYWHEYHRSQQNFLQELLIMNVITYLPHSYIQGSVEKSTGVVIPTVSMELPSSWRSPISGHRKLETIRYDGDHVLK